MRNAIEQTACYFCRRVTRRLQNANLAAAGVMSSFLAVDVHSHGSLDLTSLPTARHVDLLEVLELTRTFLKCLVIMR